jgi:hypothetical protein
MTKGLSCAHLLQQRMAQHLPLYIKDFDIQWRIDQLRELAKLPPLQKITDPLTVQTRYTKSQKRQLSLFEVINAQVDFLTTTGSRKRKDKSKQRVQVPSQTLSQLQIERGESSRSGTALQPITINNEDQEINSEDDPLGAELYRHQQASSLLLTSGIQIRGWIHYQQPKQATPPPPPSSPLWPLPELRTPTPSIFADLDFTPLPSPSPVPSIGSLFHCTPPSPPLPPPPLSTPQRRSELAEASMISPARKRPKRDAVRPQRYRDG